MHIVDIKVSALSTTGVGIGFPLTDRAGRTILARAVDDLERAQTMKSFVASRTPSTGQGIHK